MRAVLAIVGVLVVAVGAWALTRPPATAPPAASPTPAATTAPSATPEPSPSATATAAAIPTFGPATTAGAVTVRTVAARPRADAVYDVQRDPSGATFWVNLLDISAKEARTIAQVEMGAPPTGGSTGSVQVSPTAGRTRLLIVATEHGGDSRFFLLDVATGAVRDLGPTARLATGALSPDGSLFAYSDASEDAARNGVWVVPTADRSAARRVIADAPGRASGPPRPLGFTPEGTQVFAVVDFGPGDSGIAIVPTTPSSATAQIDVAARDVEGGVFLAHGSDLDFDGALGDTWAWDSVGPLGGANAVFSYDLRNGRETLVYQPAQGMVLLHVDRNPDLRTFVTHERAGVIGGGPGTITVRTRQGAATKVRDTGEAGPSRPFWSPDGRRLYGFFFGDDSVGAVGELLTGEPVLTFCVRAPSAPGFVCP